MVLSSKTERTLARLYHDVRSPSAFQSKARLYAAAKRMGINQQEVSDFLLGDPTYTSFLPVRERGYTTQFYNIYHPNDMAQIDHLDVSRYAAHQGRYKWRYLVVLVDGFTRKLFVRGVVRKTPMETLRVFKAMVRENKGKIWGIISSDEGSEYKGVFHKFLMEKGIRHWFAYTSKHKSALAERSNLILRQMLAKLFHYRKSFRYADKLQQIVRSYNNTISKSHGFKPGQIKPKDYFDVWSKRFIAKTPAIYKPTHIRKGMQVRISRYRQAFEKKSGQTFTSELFTVYQVVRRNNVDMIRLLDPQDGKLLKGYFYPSELSPIKPSV